jgi:hypothetical protein
MAAPIINKHCTHLLGAPGNINSNRGIPNNKPQLGIVYSWVNIILRKDCDDKLIPITGV